MSRNHGFVGRFPDLDGQSAKRRGFDNQVESVSSSDDDDEENILAGETPTRAPRVRYVSPPSLSSPEAPDNGDEQSVTPELPRKRTMRPSTEKKRMR